MQPPLFPDFNGWKRYELGDFLFLVKHIKFDIVSTISSHKIILLGYCVRPVLEQSNFNKIWKLIRGLTRADDFQSIIL